MSADNDLLDILKEVLERVGVVSGRRMFGGVGVYFDGFFFAIIDDGVVHLRTSETTRTSFEAEGSRPFTYATKNGPVEIGSYWRLPERLLDDPDELCEWAQRAIAAACDVSSAKEKKKRAKAPGHRSIVPSKQTKL